MHNLNCCQINNNNNKTPRRNYGFQFHITWQGITLLNREREQCSSHSGCIREAKWLIIIICESVRQCINDIGSNPTEDRTLPESKTQYIHVACKIFKCISVIVKLVATLSVHLSSQHLGGVRIAQSVVSFVLFCW